MVRAFGTVLCTGMLWCILSSAAFATDRPNLVFILADDMGVDAIEGRHWPNELGCFTPTLRRLADQGVSFTNCRVNPNCSPSRAALMTGRCAIDTGVNGVLGRRKGDNICTGESFPPVVARVTNRLSLQTQERTIAEVLRDHGYYTILVDKWHCGYNLNGEGRGLRPEAQGFHEFFDWGATICEDDPNQVGDEHVLLAARHALEAVSRRGDRPYALFFHTYTAHRLHADAEGYLWWRVDPGLTPQTAGLPTNNVNRFIQNVEAFDTVLRRLLAENGLGVIDFATQTYDPASNSVVFFMTDNGTDSLVTAYRNNGAPAGKNTLFEGGIRVPLFAFGRNISTNQSLRGTADDSQISAVDLFDTLCDVVGAPSDLRDNEHGAFPRRSMSFADRIGFAPPGSLPRRDYTLSSLGLSLAGGEQVWRLALTGDRYKLVCNSGGVGFDPMLEDEFFDLAADPAEAVNLLREAMTLREVTAYRVMRERVIDEWPAAVGAADVTRPRHYTIEETSGDGRFLLIGHVVDGVLDDSLEEFYDRFLAARPGNLVGREMRPAQRAAYLLLRGVMQTRLSNGEASSDVQVVELPLASALVMSSRCGEVDGPMTIGFEDADGPDETEYRARLTFDLGTVLRLPSGFGVQDVASARLILGFRSDSRLWTEAEYFSRDTDCGVVVAHRMTQWSNDLWNEDHFDSSFLGWADPPPHIIPNPPNIVRGVPLPQGAWLGFRGNAELRNTVIGWYADPSSNHGLLIRAERLGGVPGDQHLHFLRDARIRIVLDRRR